jgi:TolB protein
VGGQMTGRGRRRAGAVASTLILLCVVAATAHATFPGQDGRISFSRFVKSAKSVQIFTANPDGSDVRQVTDVPRNFAAVFSDWAPDGMRIAFDSDRPDQDRTDGAVQVYIANADGTGVVQLTRGAGYHADAAWAPDSASLAIEADWSQYPALEGIWIIPAADADGVTVGDARRLTTMPRGFAFESEPDYSPDGTQIVFTRFKNPRKSAIFRVNVDGSALTQLTPYKLNASAPSWSPDGQLIAFDTNDGQLFGKAGNVYVMSPDGSGRTRITDFKRLKPRKKINLANNPVWSPTGTRMMFIHFVGRKSEVMVMNADGSGQATLPLAGKHVDNRVDWGPLPTP